MLPTDSSLPDSPGATLAADPQIAVRGRGTASISGVVLDISEATVPNAHVTLTGQPGAAEQIVTSGRDGTFTFAGLPAGTYHITIVSAGLETFISSDIVVATGQAHVLPRIALPLAGEHTSVDVVVTQEQLATAEVDAASKQRFLGIFHNFYTSYLWNAAPLTPKLKFKLALRATVDPTSFVTTGARAGIEQARDTYPNYGQGAQGYAKRYGADFADNVTGHLLSDAVFPTLFHQDPRYFYRGSGSIRSRAVYAFSRAVICRGDNGRWQPNYSHITGDFASRALSDLYHDRTDRGAGLVLRDGLFNVGTNGVNSLFREFVTRKVTTNVPPVEKGK